MFEYDRYAVYALIGRKVKFRNPKRREHTVHGVLTNVRRDIFTDEVVLIVGGCKEYRLPDPTVMRTSGNDVLFEYGVNSKRQHVSQKVLEERDDKNTWKLMRERAYKESVSETMRDTAISAKVVRIESEPPDEKKTKRRGRKCCR